MLYTLNKKTNKYLWIPVLKPFVWPLCSFAVSSFEEWKLWLSFWFWHTLSGIETLPPSHWVLNSKLLKAFSPQKLQDSSPFYDVSDDFLCFSWTVPCGQSCTRRALQLLTTGKQSCQVTSLRLYDVFSRTGVRTWALKTSPQNAFGTVSICRECSPFIVVYNECDFCLPNTVFQLGLQCAQISFCHVVTKTLELRRG